MNFAGTTRIAVRTGGTLSYLLGDHLGSSSVTTNASGVKTASALYKAFGETRYSSGALGTDYKFTGQREQAELGLYFYGARWFDPSIGRFAQADTIVPTGTQGTQAWDRYAYVNNNPVRYTDPSGHNIPPPWFIATLTPMFSEGIIYSGGACLASALCITLVVVAVVVVGIVAVTSGGDVPDPKAYESGSGLNYSTPTPTPTVTAVPVTVPPMTPDLNPSTPTPYPTNGCFHSGHCVDPYLTYTPGPTNSPTSTTASCFTGLNCSTYTPANTPTLMPLPTFDLDCALNPNACPFPGAPTNTSTLPPTNQNRTEQE